jgi:rhodanese-related sulfurtransferase
MSDDAILSPAQVRERLRGGGELALLDVGDLEAYRGGHLFWATHVAPNQLDVVPALVPRRSTPIVLTEAADFVVDELHARGYQAIAVLAGGNAGWVADGGRLYAKLCVPSKALAEQAHATYGTPEIRVDELSGESIVFDVRTEPEYAAGTIPGAISCPGGEVVLRAFEERRLGAPIVVTCAGRTRAIFAAQTLIDAGMSDVAFLAGATSAWTASGRELEVGARRRAGSPGGAGARRASARLAERFGITTLDRDELPALLADEPGTSFRQFPVAAAA